MNNASGRGSNYDAFQIMTVFINALKLFRYALKQFKSIYEKSHNLVSAIV